MQEYIYYSQTKLEFPLHESIYVTSKLEELTGKNFLISNSNEVSSELLADEIEFYEKNTEDSLQNKISNIKKLYEIAEQKLDCATDFPKSKEIGNRLLIISSSSEDTKAIMKSLDKDEFDTFHIEESILKSISGSIGSLKVIVEDENSESELNVDQIVWFDMKDEGSKQSGVFDPNQTSISDVINTLRENCQNYEYRNYISYDSTICQYHERRDEVCAKCVEVCPTVAITKIDDKKHLEFSDIDCLGCGGCVSVCPSGAIDYNPINKDAIFELSLNYKDTHPLIISENMNLKETNVSLKEGILPLKIEGGKFLDELSLLTFSQVSSSQVIFYNDELSKGTLEAIRILNEIYQKKYSKDAVLVATNESELQEAINKVTFVENSFFSFNQQTMRKREAFSYRVSHIVGDEDLGVVETGPNIHYGLIKVNEDKCTLCLSCVGACNVDALIADAKTFELRVNPSLCTACGYCVASCAEEDCLSIKQDVINLNPMFFKENVLAKDKLFACIECGKEFATTKAIEKVATVMKPFFASNPTKLKTLYCCEDCKAKLMIKEGLLDA
ncbi:4Fe-4S binding protein [Halarcobacter ebronensis]|uniref:4Fe-4S ferredoxin n=1 Tax=Halarcobacter ebronensis TaxID=1462615 RepID=A0A4Q1AVX3_9BACT|nr:4Fe-4S binding protein [Halarcobacter ebronensis]QKF81803.1 [4Fe-4S] dicluster domain-containing protein [Halarcobacter ebronensis]RXK04525.1 4Fe-4S ferredoxin [Halarcobacter ebronensis]